MASCKHVTGACICHAVENRRKCRLTECAHWTHEKKEKKPYWQRKKRVMSGGQICTKTIQQYIPKKKKQRYLKGPLGLRSGSSTASKASNKQGPSHQSHTVVGTRSFMLSPKSPDIGRNCTSAQEQWSIISWAKPQEWYYHIGLSKGN